MTGSSMKPLHMPKRMIENQSLKKMMKTYDLEGAVSMIARNVEKPPWNTLEPIWRRAVFALCCLIYQASLQSGGARVFRYAYAMWVE